MTGDKIRMHCAEIDRCNQRGGRMLSIVDLIDAGTMTRDLAAYSLAAISNGASFMVGANPGGAGKTTVMGTLLNFVPPDVQLVPAENIEIIEQGQTNPEPRCCYICHEIGSGSYYAYLWGRILHAYFDLPAFGHMLATNLHAGTFQEARQQICGDNQVSYAAFRHINLIFFLSVNRNRMHVSRKIVQVWESANQSDHQPIFDTDRLNIMDSKLVTFAEFTHACEDIDRITASGARTIEETRDAFLETAAT